MRGHIDHTPSDKDSYALTSQAWLCWTKSKMTESISWPHDNLLHAYWIVPGRVLAGEYPGDPDPRRSRDKLTVLLDNGFTTFIDLTEPNEISSPYQSQLPPRSPVSDSPIERISFPIPEGQVLTSDSYDRLLTTLHDAADSSMVFIHDRLGLDRVAVVAGLFFIANGLSYEGAMRTLKERRASTRLAGTRVPSTYAQRAVLQQRAGEG